MVEPRDGRPDPDALLHRLREEGDEARTRGRFKLFFGAAPGVGKTFTMLEAAAARRDEGVDVVIGIVETHGRRETQRLTEGLPILPRRTVEHRGIVLEEFDLDAAMARRPALLLLDELAHTNAPGSRHAKRWQDVDELLDAGIDVYSTLNVQHVESLNDVVAQVTGITVRETVPDSVIEHADEIELVDVSPEVLIERLRDGKVYVPEQAARALDRFFRRGNLLALRELALRRTASRVDADMRGWMQRSGIRDTWAATDRVLACVGRRPDDDRIVRRARRLAEALDAEWIALSVEPVMAGGFSDDDRATVAAHLQLAERLGARAVTLANDDVADAVAGFVGANNVTRLVLGQPRRRAWAPWRRSLLDAVAQRVTSVDVMVVAADAPRGDGSATAAQHAPAPRLSGYLQATVVVGIVTAIGLLLRARVSTTDVAMLYILGIAIIGSRTQYRPALFASVLAILAFDLCFVPPFYTLAVSDANYLLTFAMMLVVAVLVSRLTGTLRAQADAARAREARTAAAFSLSSDLSAARAPAEISAALERHSTSVVPGSSRVSLRRDDGALDSDDGVERWAFEHRQMAGMGTQTLPASPALYLPLVASDVAHGVLRMAPADPRDVSDPARRQLLESFATQAAIALERVRLAEGTELARVEVEAERLRTSLLSSLSHDLRTPLGAIEGAASSLADAGTTLGDETRRDLAQAIVEESRRMTRMVGNLLDMIRVETGALSVHQEWQPLEEVVSVALLRLDERLAGREVTVSLPVALPLVCIDAILVEQVLINLLENALKYSPAGSPIAIGATAARDTVTVSVSDRGIGIPPGQALAVFDKFHRIEHSTETPGVGLGLTICRGIVLAHGGRIWLEARDGGGTVVRFSLPAGEPPAHIVGMPHDGPDDDVTA
ncbi:MAG: sensor histidine kinase KdpD [Gemmatimonadaceae bacterium]|nr:sensor histidine kinase KdpD [Gemmatimonadaceae bacterium]